MPLLQSMTRYERSKIAGDSHEKLVIIIQLRAFFVVATRSRNKLVIWSFCHYCCVVMYDRNFCTDVLQVKRFRDGEQIITAGDSSFAYDLLPLCL